MLTDDEIAIIRQTTFVMDETASLDEESFDALIAQAREANALRAQLAEARQQLAVQAPVIEEVKQYLAYLENDSIEYDDASSGPLEAAYSLMVVTTDEAGETTMEPATVDVTVKT